MRQCEVCLISMLVHLASKICPNESLILTGGSIDGKWTFKEGDAIALKCTIPSYSGYLKWKLNGIDVATCTPQICKQLTTGDDSFTFSFDTSNFIFEWGIHPVSMAYNKVVFECFHNSTDNANFTADVKGAATEMTERPTLSKAEIASLAIACTALMVLSIMLIVRIIKYKPLACRNESDTQRDGDTTNDETQNANSQTVNLDIDLDFKKKSDQPRKYSNGITKIINVIVADVWTQTAKVEVDIKAIRSTVFGDVAVSSISYVAGIAGLGAVVVAVRVLSQLEPLSF